ncbi:MAG: CoA activase [Nitrospinae bacterium]|nr:CoA activase [Nitrospinota bacterium]
MNKQVWIGLDIGSVSVKGAVVNAQGELLLHEYKRSHGQPIPTTIAVLSGLIAKSQGARIAHIGVTGTAGELIASLTGGAFINEIVAQSTTISRLYPHVRTLVEMGGEDSKLLMFKEEEGATVLEDFNMNNLCAAGTGSFLDQQANRIGYKIEGEFGQMALKSKHPPRIAGRCSVFAKSDMIHLQQVGTPDYDIIAGLCYAVARSYKSNVGRGKVFQRPVAFFGGVAANAGVVKALADELEIAVEDIFIPPTHAVTGAIGAALAARAQAPSAELKGVAGLENYEAVRAAARAAHNPLTGENNDKLYSTLTHPLNGAQKTGVYIGVDIGSLSTNVVARRYLRTQSRPIQAVTRGLLEIGEEIGERVAVQGVGTTGSGRYMIGDFIGADVVRNEITAQSTAAIHFIPDVDTIFEIGGQDSKYVSVSGGAVVDFEMNKVCAAGTGSFIEEQAEKIDLNIERDFAATAFRSQTPGKFGDRCTVFIESDLVSNQQKGMSKEDLAAGLAYSIVTNYLNRVVGDRRIGNHVVFQGGVAWNRAVVSAFEAVTGKKVTVTPHHDVTGAVGAAIIARRHHERVGLDKPSRFLGFDLRERKYKVSLFECKACDNVCDVSRVKFEGEAAHYYGARCELFEKDTKKKKGENTLPDLFAEREQMIFGDHALKRKVERKGRALVGVPRSLTTYELFPFWRTLLEELGFDVVLSGKTNQNIIKESIERVKAETCFPLKIMHGHVAELIEKRVDYLFIPSVISMNPKESKFRNSHTCPLVQSIPYIIRSAMDLHGAGVKILEPSIFFQRGDKHVAKDLGKLFKAEFGIPQREVDRAVERARTAQDSFYGAIQARGREVIAQAQARGERPVVIISRPYNGCDSGINLDLPRKLREMGKIALPIDFLTLEEDLTWSRYPDMYWRSGQRMTAAAHAVAHDPMLDAIFISNFKCGPDSFIERVMDQALGGKPCLHLEVDEHSADAGAVTRLEAFFDSLENVNAIKIEVKTLHAAVNGNGAMPCDTAAPGHRGGNGVHKNGKASKHLAPGPASSAFFLPTAAGPCRFGQYQRLHRIILDEMGHTGIPLLSPDGDSGYSDLPTLGAKFRRDAWRGVVAVDILTRLLHQTRPYELDKGATEQAYEESLYRVCALVEEDSGKLFGCMRDVAQRFAAIRVDRAGPRPVIGVVGEIYLRSHAFSNRDLIRRIEDLGGEVWLAPIGEWILYCTNRFIYNSKVDKKFLDLLKGYMQDIVQKKDERRLHEPFGHMLVHGEDAATDKILEFARPYMAETFEGEAILSIGKAVEFAERGLSGVVNVMPFSCMPGTIVTAISRKIREDFGNLPWLNLDYDGVEETNSRTRLEAFMYQAEQYRGKTVLSVT